MTRKGRPYMLVAAWLASAALPTARSSADPLLPPPPADEPSPAATRPATTAPAAAADPNDLAAAVLQLDRDVTGYLTAPSSGTLAERLAAIPGRSERVREMAAALEGRRFPLDLRRFRLTPGMDFVATRAIYLDRAAPHTPECAEQRDAILAWHAREHAHARERYGELAEARGPDQRDAILRTLDDRLAELADQRDQRLGELLGFVTMPVAVIRLAGDERRVTALVAAARAAGAAPVRVVVARVQMWPVSDITLDRDGRVRFPDHGPRMRESGAWGPLGRIEVIVRLKDDGPAQPPGVEPGGLVIEPVPR